MTRLIERRIVTLGPKIQISIWITALVVTLSWGIVQIAETGQFRLGYLIAPALFAVLLTGRVVRNYFKTRSQSQK
jgi:hypothetical protein